MFSDPLASENRGVFYPSRVNCGPGRPPRSGISTLPLLMAFYGSFYGQSAGWQLV